MNFENLKHEIEFGRMNANFKTVVICHLASSKDNMDLKENIARKLSSMNRGKPHPYFLKHNTVFDVLSNRLGIIKKIDNSYKLISSLNPSQKAEIQKLCKKRMEAGF